MRSSLGERGSNKRQSINQQKITLGPPSPFPRAILASFTEDKGYHETVVDARIILGREDDAYGYHGYFVMDA